MNSDSDNKQQSEGAADDNDTTIIEASGRLASANKYEELIAQVYQDFDALLKIEKKFFPWLQSCSNPPTELHERHAAFLLGRVNIDRSLRDIKSSLEQGAFAQFVGHPSPNNCQPIRDLLETISDILKRNQCFEQTLKYFKKRETRFFRSGILLFAVIWLFLINQRVRTAVSSSSRAGGG